MSEQICEDASTGRLNKKKPCNKLSADSIKMELKQSFDLFWSSSNLTSCESGIVQWRPFSDFSWNLLPIRMQTISNLIYSVKLDFRMLKGRHFKTCCNSNYLVLLSALTPGKLTSLYMFTMHTPWKKILEQGMQN